MPMSASATATRRPHFRLAGIPVRVEPLFFLIIGFLGMGQPGGAYIASWMVIATVSILLHEMGHAVAFRAFGLQPSVSLYGLGGLTSAAVPPNGDKDAFTPSRRIISSLAGPLSALIILGIPAYVIATANGYNPWSFFTGYRSLRPPPGAEIVLGQLVWINVGWSLLNLLPILPLDGGNVMLSVVELTVKKNARRITNVVSIAIGIGIGLVSLATDNFLGLVLVAMFVGLNLTELFRGSGASAGIGAGGDAGELVEARRALADYQPIAAENLARMVLSRYPRGETWRAATELTAWARLAQGDIGSGYAIAASMPPGLTSSATLRGALALAAGNTHEGVTTLAWALTHDPHDDVKLFGAIAAAQAGQTGAVAHELALLGREGLGAGRLFQGLLDYAGYKSAAAEVDHVVAAAMPTPPGWG